MTHQPGPPSMSTSDESPDVQVEQEAVASLRALVSRWDSEAFPEIGYAASLDRRVIRDCLRLAEHLLAERGALREKHDADCERMAEAMNRMSAAREAAEAKLAALPQGAVAPKPVPASVIEQAARHACRVQGIDPDRTWLAGSTERQWERLRGTVASALHYYAYAAQPPQGGARDAERIAEGGSCPHEWTLLCLRCEALRPCYPLVPQVVRDWLQGTDSEYDTPTDDFCRGVLSLQDDYADEQPSPLNDEGNACG